MKKRAVIIVGSATTGIAASLSMELGKQGVIVCSPEEVDKYKSLLEAPKPDLVLRLQPAPKFELPFQPPPTRKERRAKQRKKH